MNNQRGPYTHEMKNKLQKMLRFKQKAESCQQVENRQTGCNKCLLQLTSNDRAQIF